MPDQDGSPLTGNHALPERRAVCGAFIVDARGIVLAFDLRMEELTGWPAIEVVGRHKDLAGAKSHSNGYASVVVRSLYDGTIPVPLPQDHLDLKLHCRDGRTLDVQAVARHIGGTAGRVAVSVTRVLARSEAPVTTTFVRSRDRLTGLQQRDAFMTKLAAELRFAADSARTLALILVDVDHLRRINDRLGRAAGDEVLHKLAGILRAAVGNEDLVARTGEDDFAILLVGAGRGEARQLASRIRSNMDQVRFLSGRGHESPRVTLSVGAASFPADAETDTDLFERAREALAEARSLGRNRVWCYARRERVSVKTPVYFDGTEPLIVGFSRDLSPSGIFVQTPAPLETGMRCALAFPLPGTQDNVHVIGRVVRAVTPQKLSENPDELTAGMAIEFERFGPEDRRTIESFLHTAMSRPGRGATAES
jgi:diguanylate cyclase (GGDEF)-like protein